MTKYLATTLEASNEKEVKKIIIDLVNLFTNKKLKGNISNAELEKNIKQPSFSYIVIKGIEFWRINSNTELAIKKYQKGFYLKTDHIDKTKFYIHKKLLEHFHNKYNTRVSSYQRGRVDYFEEWCKSNFKEYVTHFEKYNRYPQDSMFYKQPARQPLLKRVKKIFKK
jgi:hypothetical protein